MLQLAHPPSTGNVSLDPWLQQLVHVLKSSEIVDTTYVRTPERYGAKGDGITDDYAAFYAAAQEGPGVILCGAKTYRMDTALNLGSGVSVIGMGPGLTIFDFSNLTAGTWGMYSIGTRTELTNLNANITAGSRTITMDAAPSISDEEIFMVCDDTNSSYSSFQASYRAGEMGIVDHVTGSAITTVKALYASYVDDANMHVYKVTPATVTFKDFSIVGPSDGAAIQGLNISLGYKCKIENVESYNWQTAAITINGCLDTIINGVNARSIINAATVGYNYGIGIYSSYHTEVANSFALADRHAITVSGSSTYKIPSRDTLVHHCQAFTSDRDSTHAIDAHGDSEYTKIDKCITDSICLGGNFNECIDNTIFSGATTAINIREPSGYSHVFDGNIIYQYADDYMLSVFALSGTATGGTVVIKNNKGYMYNTTGSRAAYQVGNNGSSQTDLRIEIGGNIWNNESGVAQGVGSIQVVSGAYLESVKMGNETYNGYGVQIAHAQTIKARDIDISGGVYGLDIYNNAPTSDPTIILIDGISIHNCAGNGLKILAGDAGNPAHKVIVRNATLKDNATAAGTNYEFYCQYADHLIFENNDIEGSNANLNYLMYIDNVGAVDNWGNVYTTTKTASWSLSNITTYRGQIVLNLADDGEFVLPTTVSSWGKVWSGGQMMIYQATTDAVVTSLLGTSDTDAADTDDKLCVYDKGATVGVKNRLGEPRLVFIEMNK